MKRHRGRQYREVPVELAVREGTHDGIAYRVVAWKPEGRPAFVYSVAMSDRFYEPLPATAEAATLDEALDAGVRYLISLLGDQVELVGSFAECHMSSDSKI